MAILISCVTVLSGCAIFRTRQEITVFGNSEKVFYKPGEAVTIAPESNSNGLWVLSPSQMQYLVLDGLEGK